MKRMARRKDRHGNPVKKVQFGTLSKCLAPGAMPSRKPDLKKSSVRSLCCEGASVRREERQCDKTEDAIKQPIAAPAWPRYGTRPPFRYLCVLPAVRSAGGGFRRRRGAPCAGRCTLGQLFGLRGAARPRARRYAIAHGIRDKVHVTNSWQSSRTCPCASL